MGSCIVRLRFSVRFAGLLPVFMCLLMALGSGTAMANTADSGSKSGKSSKANDTKARVCKAPNPVSAYVLGDSLSYGLKMAGFEVTLRALFRGPQKISFDGGRSITTPGTHIKQSALDSVVSDAAFIASSKVIIVVLGTNMLEPDFTASQTELLRKLKALSPGAMVYWVDIGATITNYATAWSERNKLIYGNADKFGYKVISRYKAIFGPDVDPFRIAPGRLFPGMTSESGYGGVGSVHGHDLALADAILNTLLIDLDQIMGRSTC